MLDKILQPLVSDMSIFKKNKPMSLALNTLQTNPTFLNFYKGGGIINIGTHEHIKELQKISKKQIKTQKDIKSLKDILSKYELLIKKI